MSYYGVQFPYLIRSKTQAELGREIDIVGNAFQNAGWIEVKIEPDTGFPTKIIFEWKLDGHPVYPIIDLSL